MADKVVEVPGLGNVAFPEAMSDDDIAAQIKQHSAPAATPQSPLDAVLEYGKGLVWDTAKGLFDTAKRVVMPPQDARGKISALVAGPLGPLISDVVMSHVDQAKKAADAAKQGDVRKAIGHGIETAIPVVGPMAANMMEAANSGQITPARAAGQGAALLLSSAGLGGPDKEISTPKLVNRNPVTADTINWAQKNDIPVPAGPATGNTFTQVMQRATESTALGSMVADTAKQKLADAMANKGRSLAAKVEPTAVVPETAGAAVTGSLESTITGLRKEADSAYGKFRTAAEDPKNAVPVQTGKPQQYDTGVLDAQGNPITQTIQATEKMPMPVDMRDIKAKLEPLYAEMKQWMPISSRNSSEGFAAIKGIVEGPDYMPAPVAEKGLSGLKAMAREADSPDLRNVSQGIGANAAGQLQKAIDAAALRAGPDIYDALRKGRTAFESKMSAANVLDKLRDEPVQLFNQATYAQDAGINQLREAAKLAPQEMPKLGRAYLEKLLDTATAEGGYDKAKGLYNQWSNLGPETKKILFGGAERVSDLDKFFRLGKLLADQPNPSMTAVVAHGIGQAGLLFTNPAVGVPYMIGSGALAKLMYSPAFVRAVTQGMKVPLKGPGAAAAAAAVMKAAGDAAQPVQQ